MILLGGLSVLVPGLSASVSTPRWKNGQVTKPVAHSMRILGFTEWS